MEFFLCFVSWKKDERCYNIGKFCRFKEAGYGRLAKEPVSAGRSRWGIDPITDLKREGAFHGWSAGKRIREKARTGKEKGVVEAFSGGPGEGACGRSDVGLCLLRRSA